MRSRWLKAASCVALLLLSAGAVVLWPTALGGGAAYVTTHGESMEPEFHDGDLAIVRPADRYAVGDVVAYHSRLLDTVVLHRIVDKHGGHYVFKGDNNSWMDRDQPTQRDLVGRLWLRVPRAGGLLDAVHGGLPVVAGVLGVLAVGGASAAQRRRGAKRQGGREMTRSPEEGGKAAGICRAASMALAALSLAGIGLAAYAWTRPTSARAASPVLYTEHGRFTYSAPAPVGPVYADGRVDTGDPVYLRLVTSIDVGFEYRFDSSAPHSVGGTVALHADVADTKGWTHTITLQPPTRFRGDTAQAHAPLDIAAIQRLISEVQQATDERDGLYTVTLVPDAQVSGVAAGRPLTTSFQPPLAFQLDDTALRLTQPNGTTQGGLQPSHHAAIPRATEVPATLHVLGVGLPVDDVRSLALLVGFLAAAAAWLMYLLMRKHARTEVDRIAMRYGHRLVPATNASHLTHTPIVDLTSMADLARVAEHTDTLIIHRHTDHGHIYVCFADLATYRFIIGTTAPPVAVPDTPLPAADLQPAAQQTRHHPRPTDSRLQWTAGLQGKQ